MAHDLPVFRCRESPDSRPAKLIRTRTMWKSKTSVGI
jgi:hypothetical protein